MDVPCSMEEWKAQYGNIPNTITSPFFTRLEVGCCPKRNMKFCQVYLSSSLPFSEGPKTVLRSSESRPRRDLDETWIRSKEDPEKDPKGTPEAP